MRIPPERRPKGYCRWAKPYVVAVAVLLVVDFLIYVVSSYGTRKVGPNGLADPIMPIGAPSKPVYRQSTKPSIATTLIVANDDHARPVRFRRDRFRRCHRYPRSYDTSSASRKASIQCPQPATRAQPSTSAPVPQAALVVTVPQAQSPPSPEPVQVADSAAIEPPVEQP